jgi:ubiquitin conjugation factor E4 B
MQGQSPSQLELDITRLEKELELYSQEKLCYEAQILRVGHVSSLFGVLLSL